MLSSIVIQAPPTAQLEALKKSVGMRKRLPNQGAGRKPDGTVDKPAQVDGSKWRTERRPEGRRRGRSPDLTRLAGESACPTKAPGGSP
jgi:hypothetical protein